MANGKEFDPTEMDKAATDAENDLLNYSEEAIDTIADWWGKWYGKAGHKRLGRVLVQIDKDNKKKGNNNITLNPDTNEFSQAVTQ